MTNDALLDGSHDLAPDTARDLPPPVPGEGLAALASAPEAALAEGFARQVQRWAVASGAAAPAAQAVAAAARAVSLATSGGHVCLNLAEWLNPGEAEPGSPCDNPPGTAFGVELLTRWRDQIGRAHV